jgi:hypothetical protein
MTVELDDKYILKLFAFAFGKRNNRETLKDSTIPKGLSKAHTMVRVRKTVQVLARRTTVAVTKTAARKTMARARKTAWALMTARARARARGRTTAAATKTAARKTMATDTQSS